MQYAFLLRPHPNVRYLESQCKLAHNELACMLSAARIDARVSAVTLGGAPWLTFSCDMLTPQQRAFLGVHSALYLPFEQTDDGLMRPLEWRAEPFMPGDMAEVQKYKGKTNAMFTRMLINLARCAGGLTDLSQEVALLDPLCGRGTTLFCALETGMRAYGIDSDKQAMHDAVTYTANYLKYNRVKHDMTSDGLTYTGGSAQATRFRIADRPRALSFIQADTRKTGDLMKKTPVHLLAADLPYGVQHAPTQGTRVDTVEGMLAQALPGWYRALRPGGAMALSFNTYTLPTDKLRKLVERAGFHVLTEPIYSDYEHWVEQAVNRNVLVARKEPTQGGTIET